MIYETLELALFADLKRLKEKVKLGADYVATGHYCRKDEIELNGETTYRLLSGKDNNTNTSKVTGLESSKADSNAPAEKDRKKIPQNEHGKK